MDDLIMDFAIIDAASESASENSSSVPSRTNGQLNDLSTPESSALNRDGSSEASRRDEMFASHAKIVQDFTLVVEKSLEKFENRIASRIASKVSQPSSLQQSVSSSGSFGNNGQCCMLPKTVHQNVYCDHCNRLITGVRYKCGMCKDYDLCEQCEPERPHQQRNHLFIKIYEPLSASLNSRPLLNQPELLAAASANPFAGFLGSLGLPANTQATLEIVHEDDVEIEIRELPQANGCQFYLSDGGARLCKDYQVTNRSQRDIQPGDYQLEHVFSAVLRPVEAKIAVPPMPEGDVRIVCLSWWAPQIVAKAAFTDQPSLLLLDSEAVDSNTLRQAHSVYRLKDRRGRHIGEPINASLALMSIPSATNQQAPNNSAYVQTEPLKNQQSNEDSCDDSFELISDEELPSCFLLDSRVSSGPPIVKETPPQAVKTEIRCLGNEEEACLVDLTSSMTFEPQLPPPPPPPPPRAAAVSEVVLVSEQAPISSTTTMTVMSAATGSVSSSAASSTQSVAAQLLSQAQSNQVHPSMLRAAAYVPKTSQWMPPQQQQQQPPPPPPPPPVQRFQQQIEVNLSSNSSSSSSDIWGPRGEQSERLQLQKLLEMGFYRRDINARVLREANWDFEAALNRLSQMYEDF